MSSKSGIQGLAEGRSDLFRLNPDLIVIEDGWNARDFEDPENQAHVQALAESIREVGVKEPLTVYMRDGEPVLTNGESRLRAIRLLQAEGVEIATVPVQTEPKHASEADRLASQILRNSGRPFSVLEQCSVFVRLLDHGMTERDVATRAGMTVERVKQIVSLNQAPAATKKLVKQGRVSATVVQRVIAKSSSAAEINEKVKAAVAKAEAEGKKKAGPRHVGVSAPKAPRAEVEFDDSDVIRALEMITNGAVSTGLEILVGKAPAKMALAMALLKMALMLDADQRGAVLDFMEARGESTTLLSGDEGLDPVGSDDLGEPDEGGEGDDGGTEPANEMPDDFPEDLGVPAEADDAEDWV